MDDCLHFSDFREFNSTLLYLNVLRILDRLLSMLRFKTWISSSFFKEVAEGSPEINTNLLKALRVS